MRNYLLLVLICTLLYSCEDTFQYSPNEVALSDTEINLNQKNLSLLNKDSDLDTIRFIFISDTHHSYEELKAFTDHVNTLSDISFVIVGGDFTNFGLQWEYQEYNNHIKKLEVPYITIIGNHDLLGNGQRVYETMFGSLNFSFKFNGHKFICVNSNSREYNFDGTVPNIGWLNNELADSLNYEQCFVLAHIAPFDPDFDPDKEFVYASTLANAEQVKLSMHGHQGTYSYTNYYSDHVGYVVTNDLSNRSYMIVKVWDNTFTCERKTF